MQWKCFWGIQLICMAKTDFAIHLITLRNILEYMQIAIIQAEAAELKSLDGLLLCTLSIELFF
jgi:hypothetical protein